MTKQAKKPLSAAKKRAIAAMRAGAKAAAKQRKLDRQADADKARYKQPKAAQPNYGKSIIERSNEIDLNKGVKMTKADIVKASRQAAEDKASGKASGKLKKAARKAAKAAVEARTKDRERKRLLREERKRLGVDRKTYYAMKKREKASKATKADIVKASQARDQVNADIAKRVMKDFVVGKPARKTATPPVAVSESATYKDQVDYMWDLLHLLIGLSIVNPNLALRIYTAAYPDK